MVKTNKFKTYEQQKAVMAKLKPSQGKKYKTPNVTMIKNAIPKSPKKDYDNEFKIHNMNMAELKNNDVSVYFDGEGNIVSYGYQHKGKTITLPEVGATKQREEIYTDISKSHPAKMKTIWSQAMIQEYSKPGDTILDPMAGIGTTGIEASRLGRNAILVEYESKWANQAKKNITLLEKNNQKKGSIKVIKGDARNVKVGKKVDVIIFSPPYGHVGLKGTGGVLNRDSNYKMYSDSNQNIGMMSGSKYYDNMKQVYDNCNNNLKNNGVMVVNTKNHIEKEKIHPFDKETIKLVESCGFEFVDHRKIKAPPSSFRSIYEKKHPNAPKLRHEDVLIFKKGN